MSHYSVGTTVELGQTEIGYFEDALFVDEEVVGFEIAMEYPMSVEIFQTL
jgi:hypothetical protein